MKMHVFNVLLLSAISLGTFLPEYASSSDVIYTFVTEIPGNLEHFVRENPAAATSVIVALASVIIFKDVVISGVKKTIKMVKENPVLSLGASLVVAGAAYVYWDHYYNREQDLTENLFNSIQDYNNQVPDLIEQGLSSVQGELESVSEKVSSNWSHIKNWYGSIKKQFDHMTYDSAQEARQVIDDLKKLTS